VPAGPDGYYSRPSRSLSDGNEIQEEKPIDYFTKIVPWKFVSGFPKTIIPIILSPFTSPTSQPSGSINFHSLRNFQVEIDVILFRQARVPTASDLTIYVENINFFEVSSGMGRPFNVRTLKYLPSSDGCDFAGLLGSEKMFASMYDAQTQINWLPTFVPERRAA
jgi:hypothetical protein